MGDGATLCGSPDEGIRGWMEEMEEVGACELELRGRYHVGGGGG